jgi:hypothetical protein
MQSLPPPIPGKYPGAGQASLLRANEQVYLFQTQLIAAGTASIAVQLERIKSGFFYPFGASMEVWFTDVNNNPLTPGAFELDWQDADVDQDSHYNTMSSLVGTASLNSNFVGRIELPTFWSKYMRALLKTMPNANVYTTVLVTR